MFLHVSTCYVNCEKLGYIEEKIYDLPGEAPEDIVAKILKMSVPEVERLTPSLIQNFPNTYTFTKSLGERTMAKRHKKGLPSVILRPAIIGASIYDPYPGWIDTFAAAGSISLAGGVGIVNYLIGEGNTVADLIPVDFVSDAIIAAAAYGARKDFTVLHMGSSHANPTRW